LAVFELKSWANFSFTSVPSFKIIFAVGSAAGGTAGEVAGAGGAAWLVAGELCAAATELKHSSNITVLKEVNLHFMASVLSHRFGTGSRWEAEGLAVGEKLPASVLTRNLHLGLAAIYTRISLQTMLSLSQGCLVVYAKMFMDVAAPTLEARATTIPALAILMLYCARQTFPSGIPRVMGQFEFS